MIRKTLMTKAVSSIVTRPPTSLVAFLLCAGVAYALGGGSAAHAVMGESAENRGLAIAEEKGTVLLACVLGGACEDNGEFFRRMAVTQINRGGTIEEGITFTGIGFGSLISTGEPPDGPLTDVFCWSGDDAKECVIIFLDDDASTSVSGNIIDARPEAIDECDDVATDVFGKPAGTFEYLVYLDENLFGRPQIGPDTPVEVVTCNDVAAETFDPAVDTLQSAVLVSAHRGMAATDLTSVGGLYCRKCK